ncbi:MAG: arginase family protein [Deltaproteobacteria bacterium]|nr:arginase family protein [Deltaproteobacteria bacterium]
MRLAIIPSPYAIDRWNEGGGKGPGALLDAGLDARLRNAGHDVVVNARARGADGEKMAVLGLHLRETAGLVARALSEGRVPLVLGGDCLVALAVAAGFATPPAVAYFDAHGDFNDETTTRSGYLPGMPLAAACGRGLHALADRVGVRAIPCDRVALIGVRDLDPEEQRVLDALPVRRFPRADAFFPLALPTYVHLDMDALDPTIAPAVTHPAPGGLAIADIVAAARKTQIAAISLTTLVPDRDPDGRTVAAALALLDGLLS